MPRIRLTKSAIDALPTPKSDMVYWDAGLPGFGIKVTPKGRKVFIVLYRTGGAGSKLRKYTIGPYGRLTPHHSRVAAQKVFAAKLEGRDPAAEKREVKRRAVGRPGRGSAGELYYPTAGPESFFWRDFQASP
jgi:Arm DNA-binding domain